MRAICRNYFKCTVGSVILYLIIIPVSCRTGCLQTTVLQGLVWIPVIGRILFYRLFRPGPRSNQPRIQWLPWLAPSGTDDHSPPFSTSVSVRNRVCRCSGNRVYSGAGSYTCYLTFLRFLQGSARRIPQFYHEHFRLNPLQFIIHKSSSLILLYVV
jgi:hypothetical protein